MFTHRYESFTQKNERYDWKSSIQYIWHAFIR